MSDDQYELWANNSGTTSSPRCPDLRPSMLALKGVGCVRNGRKVFEGANCTVAPGQLLRVQGANGAGKTSLLRVLCGLLAPTEGEVLWCGQDIATLREAFGQQLIYLGHAAALKDDLTPLENLVTAHALGGQRLTPVQARQALGLAGLRGLEDTLVRRLSQGQRRRSALARLVHGQYAPLWVLDEPFTALDVSAATWLADLVRTRLEGGGVVVLTSHQDVVIGAVPQVVLAL